MRGLGGVGGRGGFRISSYYSRCHFLNFLCLCFVRVRRKKCFNVLDLRECKAFKGYRNRWSLLLNVSSLSAGAFKRLHWLQTQSRWIFHPFLKGLPPVLFSQVIRKQLSKRVLTSANHIYLFSYWIMYIFISQCVCRFPSRGTKLYSVSNQTVFNLQPTHCKKVYSSIKWAVINWENRENNKLI